MPNQDWQNNRNENNEPMSLDEIETMAEEEKRQNKKKFSFNPFANTYKDGKGVEKDEEIITDNPSLKNFFILLKRKLNQVFTLNLLLIFGNFPLFFGLFVLAGYLSIHTTSPYYMLYAPLRGVLLFDNSASTSALWTIFSRQAEVTLFSTADYVLLGICALAILTFGPVRAGITYIYRNMVMGEPLMIWHDFWSSIRRNLRQALIFGVMDIAIVFIIIYDIMFFNLNYNASMMMSIMFFMSLMLALMYAFMRIYIYIMIVTFDLSLFKMFKNALIFTVVGVKRNTMAVLGVALTLMLNYFLLTLYFPLGIILPFVITPSLCIFIGVYAAFPKIKEFLIDSYYEKTEAEYDETL